jgi:hypothetical protein
VFTDKTSGEEILRSNLVLQGDSRFDDITYVINDFTQIVEFEVSDLDINKIVTIDHVAAISNPKLKIAIVATLESLLAWVHLYCEKMQDSPFECKIFDNLNDAYKWVSE